MSLVWLGGVGMGVMLSYKNTRPMGELGLAWGGVAAGGVGFVVVGAPYKYTFLFLKIPHGKIPKTTWKQNSLFVISICAADQNLLKHNEISTLSDNYAPSQIYTFSKTKLLWWNPRSCVFWGQTKYSLFNIEFSAAHSVFFIEYWIQRRKEPILCWI